MPRVEEEALSLSADPHMDVAVVIEQQAGIGLHPPLSTACGA